MPDTNPPPTGFGGPLSRSDAPPYPGPLPLGRRAGGPPRRRVSELTSHRARKQKEIELASSEPTPRISPDAPRACGVPIPPCSPPLVARSLTRLAIRSGQSHPGLLTQAKPARPRLKSHCPCAIRPPTATGESTPSVTLPPTSPPAIVWRGDAPVLQSPGIDRRSTRAAQARAASGIHLGQPAPKIALKAIHKIRPRPEECAGVARSRQSPSAIRHDSSRFIVPRHDLVVLGGHFGTQGATPAKETTWDGVT